MDLLTLDWRSSKIPRRLWAPSDMSLYFLSDICYILICIEIWSNKHVREQFALQSHKRYELYSV